MRRPWKLPSVPAPERGCVPARAPIRSCNDSDPHPPMIDLHCHILPGLDDGAFDMDDAVAMASQAENSAITHICATPHIRDDHDVVTHEIAMRVDALNAELERHGLTPRVLPGGEVAEASVDGLGDEELAHVSLGGGGRWILLEPRPGPLSDSLVTTVRVLRERGFRAVLAHPERHLGRDSPQLLTAAVELGALVQVTADHFREPGSGLLLDLAADGLIHLLGSDAHSAHFGRPVNLAQGVSALATVQALAPHLGWILHDAPAALVRGENVVAPYPATWSQTVSS